MYAPLGQSGKAPTTGGAGVVLRGLVAIERLADALHTARLGAGMALPIAVRKYDGHQRFLVETTVLAATPQLLVARGPVGRRFITAEGTRHLSTISLEYFPAGRW